MVTLICVRNIIFLNEFFFQFTCAGFWILFCLVKLPLVTKLLKMWDSFTVRVQALRAAWDCSQESGQHVGPPCWSAVVKAAVLVHAWLLLCACARIAIKSQFSRRLPALLFPVRFTETDFSQEYSLFVVHLPVYRHRNKTLPIFLVLSLLC